MTKKVMKAHELSFKEEDSLICPYCLRHCWTIISFEPRTEEAYLELEKIFGEDVANWFLCKQCADTVLAGRVNYTV